MSILNQIKHKTRHNYFSMASSTLLRHAVPLGYHINLLVEYEPQKSRGLCAAGNTVAPLGAQLSGYDTQT